jgi:predicted amidohydrolase YtcJ
MYGFTARTEIDAMRRLGIWSEDELLRLWFSDTPRSIFPSRRVGRLADGYEASFLVLDRNPFEKLEAIHDIRLGAKQGWF